MDTQLHFRLTGSLTAQQVNQGIIEALSPSCKSKETLVAVVTGFEIGTKNKQKHTHSAIYTNLSKETTRDRLKKYFKCSKSEYQLSSEDNMESNLSYVTKGGDIYASQNFEELIRPLEDINPWQFRDLDFDDQVKELDQTYLDSTMDDDSYLNSLLTIYGSSQKKSLFLHPIKAHWLALLNRRNLQGSKKIYHDPEDHTTRWETIPFNPRQELVNSIKKYIVD